MPVRGSRTPFYSILTTGQQGGHYYTHFPEEEAEAQKSEVIRVYSRGWERGMCPHAGRPGFELHVDSAAVFSWENIYKRGLPSLLTPHSPYVPPGSWGHVAMVPRNGELRQGKLRCEEPICSRGRHAERGSASGEGPRLQGLAVERTRRGEGAGDPGSEAQGEGDGKRCEEQVSEKAGLGGEAGCNESESEKGSKEKGPRHREDLSLHGDTWSSQKSRGPSWKVVSSPSLEVCKQDCVDLRLRHPSEHLCLL